MTEEREGGLLVPEEARLEGALEQTGYLVGGKILHWEGEVERVFSPIRICLEGESEPGYLGSYPKLSAEESLTALDAAVAAYDSGRGEWPSMRVAERIRHVEEFAYRLVERRERVVRLLMWEICKNRLAAEREFDRTVEYIRDTVDALKELDRNSSRFDVRQGILAQVRRAPLGVVLCMGPFNYPLNETFTTLIPALIMGNTAIFKPAKLGVLLHEPILEAYRESFPPGVVNTVYGDGRTVIGPLMESGKIDVLAFIGSSRVANVLERQHPRPNRLRSVLGLEAKNPAIILPDADMDVAVSECMKGSLSYNGQRCTALKILFVHRDIAGAFVTRFSEAIGKLRAGMPWEEAVSITPLPEPGKPDWLDEMVEDALSKGAREVVKGGLDPERNLYLPRVLYPVSPDATLYSEEQFGPVVPVVPFDDVEEPIRYVVESNFGQQASIFGQNQKEVARLIDQLVNQVCRVNLNSQCQRGPDHLPFTGRKDSAVMTLSVTDALRAFSIRTLVAARSKEANHALVTQILREHRSKFLSTDFLF